MCKTSCQHHRSFLRGGITSLTPRRLYLHYLESCTACPTQLWASLEDFSHVVAAQPVTELASDPSVCKYRHPPILFFLHFSKINVLNLAFVNLWNVFIICLHACMYIQQGQLWGVISLIPPCGSWGTKRPLSSGAACSPWSLCLRAAFAGRRDRLPFLSSEKWRCDNQLWLPGCARGLQF